MQLRDLFDEIQTSQSTVIPFEFQQLLREPLDVYHDWERCEKLLLNASALMPERLEILVALYKMYAYTNKYDQALSLIEQVLLETSRREGFSANWRELDKNAADFFTAKDNIRLYLYTMKATGFVSLRRGDVKLACEVLDKLAELDPTDQVGGSVVQEMAERVREELEEAKTV